MLKLALLLVLASLVACAPVLQHSGEEGTSVSLMPFTARADDVAYWLEEWSRVIELPESEQQRVLKTREDEFEKSADTRTRLRLALLLAEGPKPVRDQNRAIKLLKEMDLEKADDSARALAMLLEQVIGEQHWAGDKISELRTRLKQAETRVGELERQLQELTNIEQSIQQRDEVN